MLKSTPFHARTAPLVRAETWRRWAGYRVASAYEPVHDREYAAVRNSAALFDVSPLYKYHLRGRDAARLLNKVLTRDMHKCAVGRVMYTVWCNTHGKVIDDGTVARLDDNHFRLTSAEPSLRWLGLNARGMDVVIEDVSDRVAALALQGPLSRDILARVAETDMSSLGYFRLVHASISGRPVTISRTGYTGDLGYELWTAADGAVHLWDELLRAGNDFGITPAGIWALDIARIEAGLVMLGVDYHSAHHALIDAQLSSPLELGLGWTVASDKGPFNGDRALRAEAERSAEWRLAGIEVDWESLERLHSRKGLAPHLPTIAWRSSVPIYAGDGQVGYATSGCWSPLLKKYIALAHLRAPHHAPGTRVGFELTVEHERQKAAARVVALPFLDPPRKRA